MKKRKVILSTIMLSAVLFTACSTDQPAYGPASMEEADTDREDDISMTAGSEEGSDNDREDGSEVIGDLNPVISGDIVPVSTNVVFDNKVNDGSGMAEGQELWALASSEEEAQQIAELYGIELVLFAQGVATYHTEEDPGDVVQRGRDNDWPAIAVNSTGNLVY